MALTYAQLDALTTNAALIGRVRQCVAYQADYWLNFAGATGEQTWWAAKVFQGLQCGQIAANLMRELAQDAALIGSTTGDGSDVTDAALQAAVGKICIKYLSAPQ